MFRRTTVASIVAGALIVVLWGCGAAATPIPSAGAASQAAPSAAASPAEASAAPSTEASAALPSVAVPSLPSEAKDLEALLPDTLCGAAATKTSLSGASFAATAQPEFKAALAALGKSPSDVAFAIAFSTSGCGAGIFRIAGVDQATLQQTFLAEQQKSGTTFTQGSVGGKTVFISDQGSSGKQYLYFAGDAVIFASAKDDASAATILQALPG
ncbi:MAG: hypothetical protein E6I26_06535 [Chloroflexi bacterium]|nr:MAG: hypothetical protein E6I26_06535 [Chloroflexota bacterium]